MSSSKKKDIKGNKQGNNKEEFLQKAKKNMSAIDLTIIDSDQEEEIPTTQELYYRCIQKEQFIKSNLKFLYLVSALLLMIIYCASSEQYSDKDLKQVNLNIVLSDDFESYLESNPDSFEFNYTNIFIEYQKIQFENTQTSSMRYYISLFDKYVLGQIQDGQIINSQEQQLLKKCIDEHDSIKQSIIENIQTLKNTKQENIQEQNDIIVQEVEEMGLYLQFRNSTFNFISKKQNKMSIYNDYHIFAVDKIKTLTKQIDILDKDIIINELDVLQKNINLIEIRSKQDEKAIIKSSMQDIIIKNTQKIRKTEMDKIFEGYLKEENQLKKQVFEKRLSIQNRKNKLSQSTENYYQLYENGVKKEIQKLIDSFFECIS